mmetsp:Transcript_26568/g.67636  ORF Transcript_26568/g.67636 Transcript_26568/m.67636 type:complete len:216 (-) Transcript_26568:325-972(-)
MRPSSNTRSNPPTTIRFRCSSVAMRSVRLRCSVLWYVTNGRASAPPATDSSTGVSTSRNPLSSKHRRMVDTMRERARNVRRVSSVTIMSTYRCLYRFSTSVRPCHLSGSGSSDLVSTSSLVAATLSSPFSVRFTPPCAPTMSPTSTCVLRRSNAPSPHAPSSAAASTYSWIWPLSSRRDRNASLPITRLAITRPATATLTSPSATAPGASSLYCS